MIHSDQMVITKWRKRVIGSFILVIICTVVVSLLLAIYSFSEQTIWDLQSLITLSVLIHAIFIGIFCNILYKNAGIAFAVSVFTLILSFFAMGIGMFLFTIFLLFKSKKYLKENVSG